MQRVKQRIQWSKSVHLLQGDITGFISNARHIIELRSYGHIYIKQKHWTVGCWIWTEAVEYELWLIELTVRARNHPIEAKCRSVLGLPFLMEEFSFEDFHGYIIFYWSNSGQSLSVGCKWIYKVFIVIRSLLYIVNRK